MNSAKIALAISFVLTAAACTGPRQQIDARMFPDSPKGGSLTIVEPPNPWGPVTVISRDGSAPIRLSQEGVSIEGVGSSTAPTGK